MWYGWEWSAGSLWVPSVVKNCCGMWVSLRSLPDVLRKHIGDVGWRGVGVVSDVVSGFVESANE